MAITEGIYIPVKKYRVDHKHRIVISPICKTQEKEQFIDIQQIIIKRIKISLQFREIKKK